MGQLRVSDAINFGHEPDYFGPQFEAFTPKPKKNLPKSDPFTKTIATEKTDRQIREQIRARVALAHIEIVHVTRVAVAQDAAPKQSRKKQALRRRHATPDRVRELPLQDERAGEQLVEIKLGLSMHELAQFYERERQRYLEVSGHAALLTHGRRKVKERVQAHAILKGLADGVYHPEASPAAWEALQSLTENTDARQLSHVLKVTRDFPLTLVQRIRFMRLAPQAVFLNKGILQPFLDRVLRTAAGAPVTNDTQPCILLRQLPAIAELAMEQSVRGKPDFDCITPGDLRSYVEDLAAHPTVRHMPFYVATLEGCLKDIRRVPRNRKLRQAGKAQIEAAFAASARLLLAPVAAPITPAPAVALVVPLPGGHRLPVAKRQTPAAPVACP